MSSSSCLWGNWLFLSDSITFCYINSQDRIMGKKDKVIRRFMDVKQDSIPFKGVRKEK